MQVEVTKFTGLLSSGYVMVVGNHQCNTANLNQSKPQFQLELSLAQFSPSLFHHCVYYWAKLSRGMGGLMEIRAYSVSQQNWNFGLAELGNRPHQQTWKKTWTRGHCPRKFLRIVEISGLWKIDYSYFGIKLMNCENFFLNIKYLAYL